MRQSKGQNRLLPVVQVALPRRALQLRQMPSGRRLLKQFNSVPSHQVAHAAVVHAAVVHVAVVHAAVAEDKIGWIRGNRIRFYLLVRSYLLG